MTHIDLDATLSAMTRGVLPSTLVGVALIITACGGAGPAKQAPSNAGRSGLPIASTRASSSTAATLHAHLLIVVPEMSTRIHATKVLLGTSELQIGRVVEVDPAGQHEARLRIALTRTAALHVDARAAVCDNAVRIEPGSPSTPVAGPDLVIPIVRTVIRPGNC